MRDDQLEDMRGDMIVIRPLSGLMIVVYHFAPTMELAAAGATVSIKS